MTSTPEPWPLLSRWPPTRFSDWRVRSSLARFLDVVVGVAGAALIGVSLIDAIASFWHDTVLIYPTALQRFAGVVLLPCWPWILVSAWMVYGMPRRGRSTWTTWRENWRRGVPWLGAFAVIVAVIVIGFVLGASKGSLRVLPGGVHQVSTLDLNSAEWTKVSPAGYRTWAARFIREDAFFATFGLAMVGFVAAIWSLPQWLTESGIGDP